MIKCFVSFFVESVCELLLSDIVQILLSAQKTAGENILASPAGVYVGGMCVSTKVI